jgi:hypothetical protein
MGSYIGYLSVVYILTRGWFCFVFKKSEDAELVLKCGMGGEPGKLNA